MLVEFRKKHRKIYVNGVFITQIKHNGYYYTISDKYYNPNNPKQKNHSYYNPKEYVGEKLEDCFNIFIYNILPTIVEDLLNHAYEYRWSGLGLNDYKIILREHKIVLDLFKDFSPDIAEVLEKLKKHPLWLRNKRINYKMPFSVVVNNLITFGFIYVIDGKGTLTKKGLLSYSSVSPKTPKYKSTSELSRSSDKKCLSCSKKIEWYQTYCISCNNKQAGK